MGVSFSGNSGGTAFRGSQSLARAVATLAWSFPLSWPVLGRTSLS